MSTGAGRFCPRCGSRNDRLAERCARCFAELTGLFAAGVPAPRCTACGADNPPSAIYCMGCGRRLDQQRSSVVPGSTGRPEGLYIGRDAALKDVSRRKRDVSLAGCLGWVVVGVVGLVILGALRGAPANAPATIAPTRIALAPAPSSPPQLPTAIARIVYVVPSTPTPVPPPPPSPTPTLGAFAASEATRRSTLNATMTATSLDLFGDPQRPWPGNQPVLLRNSRWRIVAAQLLAGKAVVVVEVENLTASPQQTQAFELIDSRGRQFKPAYDSDAARGAPNMTTTGVALNPNVPVQFTEVFPLPTDAAGLKAHLTDVGDPKGVYVTLPGA